MEIKVNRKDVRPPVENVTLTLTADEAKALGEFFGHTSRSKISYVMDGGADEKFKDILFPVIAMVYDTLYGEEVI